MKRKLTSFLVALTVLVVMVLGVRLAYAEQDVQSGGTPAVVHLNFKVTVPKLLFLRIGSAGATIDEVAFLVTNVPEEDPTISGDITPDVRVGAIIASAATVTLSADSSTDMQNVALDNMPFSTIATTGTGDFSGVSALAFDGTGSQQIWQDTGKGFRTGTFSFLYTNSYTYAEGVYTGQVEYTLSSP